MTLSMQLLSRLTSLGVSLSLDGDELLVSAPANAITAALHAELVEHKAEIVALLKAAGKKMPISAQSNDDETLLSHAQRRIWFLSQIEPESAVWNVASIFSITGRLDLRALELAFTEIVSRHFVLRCTFASVDGIPYATIAPPPEWSMERRRIGDTGALDAARAAALDPIDLKEGPLFRAVLFEVGPERFYLGLSVHHIVCDGWSLGLLSMELSALYNAFTLHNASPLPAMQHSYAEYVNWELRAFAETSQTDVDWWRQKLDEPPPPLDLGRHRRRASTPDHEGRRLSIEIPATDAGRFHLLARECGVTSFMLFLAAFKVLLFRYTGVEDIVIGTVSSYRKRREFEQLIGMFANPVALRTSLSGGPSFRELLHSVKETVAGAFLHDTIPFDRLIEELHPNRKGGSTPFFQVSFVYQNLPPAKLTLNGVRVSQESVEVPHARYDLSVETWTTDTGMRCDFEFRTGLFDVETIERMQGHYLRILEAGLAEPDTSITELPILSEIERTMLISDWNGQPADYPNKPVHALFEEQSERNRNAIALADDRRRVSYGELNRLATSLAIELRQRGVGLSTSVGILMERSVESIVAMLAILKCGGVYLVLDTEYPEERLRFLLQDADAQIVLTNSGDGTKEASRPKQFDYLNISQAWTSSAVENPQYTDAGTTLDSPMCLLYTSGSTGTPKGVEICHRGLVRLLFSRECQSFGLAEAVLHMAPESFDASLLEIWGPLVHGGCCVLYRERQPDLPALKSIIEKNDVRAAWLTSSLFNWIVDEAPDALASLERIYTGGEALSVPHVRRAFEALPNVTILNGYGPTEATVFTCLYVIPRELSGDLDTVPIGRPIANTKAYVLDANRQLVPVGVPGELYIGGDALALGYRNRPELNAKMFIPNPFTKTGRLYRSGDRCAYLPDGNIQFIGRLDLQVKIRGHRIELGEVEAAIGRYPGVSMCAVSARKDDTRGDILVAWFAGDADCMPELLRDALATAMPPYMVPSILFKLDAFPLLDNGKVDRAALTVRSLPKTSDSKPIESPGRGFERDMIQLIAQAMAELLGLQSVRHNDDFFALGGHSLLAMQLIARIEALLGRRISVAMLFQTATPETIARFLEEESTWLPQRLVPLRSSGKREPLFCVHLLLDGSIHDYLALVRSLDSSLPVYALCPGNFDLRRKPVWSLEEIAAEYILEIKKVKPSGPYRLCGYSSAGILAFEMARQLRQEGRPVDLFLLDGFPPATIRSLSLPQMFKMAGVFARSRGRRGIAMRLMRRTGRNLSETATRFRDGLFMRRPAPEIEDQDTALVAMLNHAMNTHRPQAYAGNAVLFKAQQEGHYQRFNFDGCNNWKRLVRGVLDIRSIPGNHRQIMQHPSVELLSHQLQECLLQEDR